MRTSNLLIAVTWIAGAFLVNVTHADLIAAYTFNDTGLGTNVPDESGNGNTGTFSDGASYEAVDVPTGVGGAGAARFIGGTSAMGVLVNSFSSITANNTATAVFWLKAGPAQQTNIHLGTLVNGGNRQFSTHAAWDDTNVYFDTGGCCTVPDQRLVSGGHGDANNWVHWGFVKDGNDKFIYKNGAVIASSIGTATSPMGVINVAGVGNWNAAGPNGVNGLMDEVGIFDTALSQPEIESIMNLGLIQIPEPSSFSLAILGLLGILALRRRIA